MQRYKQIQIVPWLKTPNGTIWTTFLENDNSFIQPEDVNLRDTPLGVDISTFSYKELKELFEEIYVPVSGNQYDEYDFWHNETKI